MSSAEVLGRNDLRFPELGIELNIGSDAFTIFGFTIKWYGLIIAVGLLLAMLYGYSQMKRFGIDSDRATDAIVGGIIGGIVGARLYYVAFAWDEFADDWTKIFNIRQGGLAIYGGLIGALLVGCIVAKIRKMRLLPLLDVVGMSFLIGQGVGRWGNFFNHEAFGSNTNLPWGMTSGRIQSYLAAHQAEILESTGVTVDPFMPVHPCFLYESIWCLLGALVLYLLSKHRKFDGEMFLMYLAWYGAGRSVIEGLRTDSLMLGSLRISQVLSILLVITSIILIIVFRGKVRRMGEDYKLYVNTEESAALIAETAARYEKQEQKKAEKKAAKSDKSADAPTESIIIDDTDKDTPEENTDKEEDENVSEDN